MLSNLIRLIYFNLVMVDVLGILKDIMLKLVFFGEDSIVEKYYYFFEFCSLIEDRLEEIKVEILFNCLE